MLDVTDDTLDVTALLVQGLEAVGSSVEGAAGVESQQCTDLNGVQAALVCVHLQLDPLSTITIHR